MGRLRGWLWNPWARSSGGGGNSGKGKECLWKLWGATPHQVFPAFSQAPGFQQAPPYPPKPSTSTTLPPSTLWGLRRHSFTHPKVFTSTLSSPRSSTGAPSCPLGFPDTPLQPRGFHRHILTGLIRCLLPHSRVVLRIVFRSSWAELDPRVNRVHHLCPLQTLSRLLRIISAKHWQNS